MCLVIHIHSEINSHHYVLAGPTVFVLGTNSQIITTNVSTGDNFTMNCAVRVPDCSPVILLTTPQGNVTVTSDPVYTVTNIQSSFDYICIADNGNFVSTLTFRISVLPTCKLPCSCKLQIFKSLLCCIASPSVYLARKIMICIVM